MDCSSVMLLLLYDRIDLLVSFQSTVGRQFTDSLFGELFFKITALCDEAILMLKTPPAVVLP